MLFNNPDDLEAMISSLEFGTFEGLNRHVPIIRQRMSQIAIQSMVKFVEALDWDDARRELSIHVNDHETRNSLKLRYIIRFGKHRSLAWQRPFERRV